MNPRALYLIVALIVIVLAVTLVIHEVYKGQKGIIHQVKIVEWHDRDAVRAFVIRVIDGDTIWVKLENGSKYRVRLVGYNAWELNEPLGPAARGLLKRLLDRGEIYLDIDDYEPFDRYGRLLGYVWFRRGEAYCLLNKAMLVVYRRYVKNPLYIPPDEHPWWVMTRRYVVDLADILKLPRGKYEVLIENCTGIYRLGKVKKVVMTGGVYLVYVDGNFKGIIYLLSTARRR